MATIRELMSQLGGRSGFDAVGDDILSILKLFSDLKERGDEKAIRDLQKQFLEQTLDARIKGTKDQGELTRIQMGREQFAAEEEKRLSPLRVRKEEAGAATAEFALEAGKKEEAHRGQMRPREITREDLAIETERERKRQSELAQTLALKEEERAGEKQEWARGEEGHRVELRPVEAETARFALASGKERERRSAEEHEWARQTQDLTRRAEEGRISYFELNTHLAKIEEQRAARRMDWAEESELDRRAASKREQEKHPLELAALKGQNEYYETKRKTEMTAEERAQEEHNIRMAGAVSQQERDQAEDERAKKKAARDEELFPIQKRAAQAQASAAETDIIQDERNQFLTGVYKLEQIISRKAPTTGGVGDPDSEEGFKSLLLRFDALAPTGEPMLDDINKRLRQRHWNVVRQRFPELYKTHAARLYSEAANLIGRANLTDDQASAAIQDFADDPTTGATQLEGILGEDGRLIPMSKAGVTSADLAHAMMGGTATEALDPEKILGSVRRRMGDTEWTKAKDRTIKAMYARQKEGGRFSTLYERPEPLLGRRPTPEERVGAAGAELGIGGKEGIVSPEYRELSTMELAKPGPGIMGGFIGPPPAGAYGRRGEAALDLWRSPTENAEPLDIRQVLQGAGDVEALGLGDKVEFNEDTLRAIQQGQFMDTLRKAMQRAALETVEKERQKSRRLSPLSTSTQ